MPGGGPANDVGSMTQLHLTPTFVSPPRWAVMVAHAIPLIVLPASIWRIVLGFGVTMGASRSMLENDGMPGWGTVYVLVLSLVSEAAALISLGLVRPWGEIAPRWMPLIGGRRIPPLAAVVPAVIGGLLLTAIWTFAISGIFDMQAIHGTGWRLLMYACYLPTLLWGPLLLLITHAYWVRRRQSGTHPR